MRRHMHAQPPSESASDDDVPSPPPLPLRSICVFCGGMAGNGNDQYAAAAAGLGALLAREEITLVYGGGGIGLMGVLANAVLAHGGTVLGIIPYGLLGPELAHPELAELRVVNSMHERKAQMVAASDGFITLPGGFGTLDELAEVLTWAQLGIHRKPIAMLNTNHFYDHFLAHAAHAEQQGLLRPIHREILLVDDDAERLLHTMRTWRSPLTSQWTTPPDPPLP
jgi:uncharacterized protein (TIGR00730 family)